MTRPLADQHTRLALHANGGGRSVRLWAVIGGRVVCGNPDWRTFQMDVTGTVALDDTRHCFRPIGFLAG